MFFVAEQTLRDFLETHTQYCIVEHDGAVARPIDEAIRLAQYYVHSQILRNQYREISKNCESLVLHCKLKYDFKDFAPAPEAYMVGSNVIATSVALLCLYTSPHLLSKAANHAIHGLPSSYYNTLEKSLKRYACEKPALYTRRYKIHLTDS